MQEKLECSFVKHISGGIFTAVKSILIIVCLFAPLLLSASRFSVVNNSGVSRLADPVIVTRESLKGMMFVPRDKIPSLFVDDKLIPSQADDFNGDGTWDEIAFQIDIERNSRVVVKIKWIATEEKEEFPQKVYAGLGVRKSGSGGFTSVLSELQPEGWTAEQSAKRYRFEGPFWENENLAFRHLFDDRISNCLMVKSGKRILGDTVRPGQPDWLREIIAYDSGMGAGNFAVEHAGAYYKIRGASSVQYQLLASGPVRAVFQLLYEDWKLGDDLLNVKNRISIWAGQQSYKSELVVTGFSGEKEILAGFSLPSSREKAEIYSFSKTFGGVFSHTSNPMDESDNFGIALIHPKSIGNGPVRSAGGLLPEEMTGKSASVLFKVQSGQSIHYHIFCGWEKANEKFANVIQFRNSLAELAASLESPLKIEP